MKETDIRKVRSDIVKAMLKEMDTEQRLEIFTDTLSRDNKLIERVRVYIA